MRIKTDIRQNSSHTKALSSQRKNSDTGRR